MKSRLIVAAIGVPVLFVVLFFLPPLVTGILFALISAAACFELMQACLPKRGKPVTVATLICAALVPVASCLRLGAELYAGIATVYALVLFFYAFSLYPSEEKRVGLDSVTKAMYCGFVMPLMLSAIVRLRCMDDGRLYVLLPIIITFLGDTGSFFVGRAIGKHKLAPALSPNKTVEGALGSIVSSIAFALIYGAILKMCGLQVSFVALMCYGFLGSLVSQLGDLVYSFIKREAGIKDYGHILGEHGGFMDRFDALSFNAPFIELLLLLFPAFMR